MDRYIYELSGLYNDRVKMKKGNIVLHNDNTGYFTFYEKDTFVMLMNYGGKIFHPCELKILKNIAITVPCKEYLFKKDYLYVPVVFNEQEFIEFCDVVYMERMPFNSLQC